MNVSYSPNNVPQMDNKVFLFLFLFLFLQVDILLYAKHIAKWEPKRMIDSARSRQT